MAPTKKTFTRIEVDGEQVRPREAMWIVYNPKGIPVSAFPSDAATQDNIPRAARAYWVGDTNAIIALNRGYSIRLTTMKKFISTIAAQMKPES